MSQLDTKQEHVKEKDSDHNDSNSSTYKVESNFDDNLLDALREAEEHAAQLKETEDVSTSETPVPDQSAEANSNESSAKSQVQNNEIIILKKAVADYKKEAENMREAMMRARADLENARRRFEREQKESQLYAAEKTLKAMVPVVDDLDLALANLPEGGDANIAEGVKLVHRKFLQALESQGAKTFYPMGEAFDPSSHEALMEMESDEVDAGHIVQVFQRGWTLNSRLLRPAKVIIAK
jgi:molecular chaperone GrpE